MKTLEFKLQINAPVEVVWTCLWDAEHYKEWTSVFCEGSYYQTDSFAEGSKIHLLTPSGEGMFSVLDKIVENKFLAFKHLGEIKNFEEQATNDTTQAWSNAMETYELKPNENGVELIVNVDTIDEYINSMNNLFPVALRELKKIAEK